MSPDSRSLADRVGAPISVREPRHPDVAQWRAVTPADIDALMVLHAACDSVDSPTSRTARHDVEYLFSDPQSIDPARDTLIGVDADGLVIASGTAITHPDRSTEIFVHLKGRVHPRMRRRGIGQVLGNWELDRAQQALAETGVDLPGAILLYAAEDDIGAKTIAQNLGLQPERWFTAMVCDLSVPIPDPPELPDGISVVPCGPELSEGARRARNDSFRDHWGSLATSPAQWEHQLDSPYFRPDLSWVAVDANSATDESVAAFAMGFAYRQNWVHQGYSSVYIDLIGVRRAWRGRKLAIAVIGALLRAAADAGLDKATLDVDADNPSGAQHMYASLGFTPTDQEVVLVARY